MIGFGSEQTREAVVWNADSGLNSIGQFTPHSINDSGTIVGSAGHAVIWDQDNGLRDLGLGFDSQALSVNNSGTIVGRYYFDGYPTRINAHAFIMDNEGNFFEHRVQSYAEISIK